MSVQYRPIIKSCLYGIKEGRELKYSDVLYGNEAEIRKTILKYSFNPEEYQKILSNITNMDDMLQLYLAEDGLHIDYRTTGSIFEALVPEKAPELKISWWE